VRAVRFQHVLRLAADTPRLHCCHQLNDTWTRRLWLALVYLWYLPALVHLKLSVSHDYIQSHARNSLTCSWILIFVTNRIEERQGSVTVVLPDAVLYMTQFYLIFYMWLLANMPNLI
jgi:hypothetical protein